jgi:hypothetical protein
MQQQQGAVRRPQGSQRFFVGHSAFVCCLALGGEGQLLATGQEGKAALIRLWGFRPGQQQQQIAERVAAEEASAGNSGTCLAVLCGERIAEVLELVKKLHVCPPAVLFGCVSACSLTVHACCHSHSTAAASRVVR